MNAEVIAIGDELTSGQRVDTNSAWISQRLGEIGIRVLHHSTVADDLESCGDVFRKAFARVDIVVCTGGLGPTADDLTREAIAEAMEVDLVQDDTALDHIRGMFESRGREMPPKNTVQAQFPEGSRVVPNPHGTAPGIDVDVPRKDDPKVSCRCFALPGVPAEMKEMWVETVLPELRNAGAGRKVIVHHELKCFGLGESDCERRLPDVVRRGREPSVGITVHKATITLRITAEGEDENACRTKIDPTVSTIRKCLDSFVFGEGNVTLHEVVFDKLASQNLSLVTAEWGTSGILSSWLAEQNGGGSTYLGGIVGGKGDTTSQAGLLEIVERYRSDADADFGLGVGQWNLPADRSVQVVEGTKQLIIVLAARSGETDFSVIPHTGHPDIIPERTAKLALNLLRKHILARRG